MGLKAFEGKSLKRGILLYSCIQTSSSELTPEFPVMFLLLSMAILLTFMFLFGSILELLTYSSISFSEYPEFRIFVTHMFYCYTVNEPCIDIASAGLICSGVSTSGLNG